MVYSITEHRTNKEQAVFIHYMLSNYIIKLTYMFLTFKDLIIDLDL